MSYSRTTWIPEETPLSADNLNNIEDGIEESLNRLDAIASNTELFNAIYPIGSIYMSTSSTNPAAYFGGTWVAWGQGRVPVGVGTSDRAFAANETGGTSNAIVPSHNHTATFTGTAVGDHTHTGPSHTHTVTGDAASGGEHTHTATITIYDAGQHHHTVKTRTVAASGSGVRSAAWPQDTMYSDSYNVYTSDSGSHKHSASGIIESAGAHQHSVTGIAAAAGTGATSAAGAHTPAGTVTVTSSGESVTDKNLQPYITCYMWKRTA